MKNFSLTATLLLLMLVYSTRPSLAQYNNQNNSSSSNTMPMQFMAPNYWGDARVKNRSTATNNQQSNSAPPSSGGRSGGGGGISPYMFMGPAMMVPAMLRRSTGHMHPNHKPRKANDDDDNDSKQKKKKKHSKERSVNDENNMPDPMYPMQGMSALSKKTLDMQNGNTSPQMDDPRMRVTGVMQDEEVSAQMQTPGQVQSIAPLHPEQFQVQSPAQQQLEAPVRAQLPSAGDDQAHGVGF
ncbi:MAG: hypothetical protein DKT66_07550 [Candidatus Melainabacteria bacterium]|nr:MAG: hypothetical protein DKT66_07550 [Candidatus Melainabacteria bacterium]